MAAFPRFTLPTLAVFALTAGSLSAQGAEGSRQGFSLSRSAAIAATRSEGALALHTVADHRTTGALVAGGLFVGALGWVVYRSTRQEAHAPSRPLMIFPIGAAVVGVGALVGSFFPKE